LLILGGALIVFKLSVVEGLNLSGALNFVDFRVIILVGSIADSSEYLPI